MEVLALAWSPTLLDVVGRSCPPKFTSDLGGSMGIRKPRRIPWRYRWAIEVMRAGAAWQWWCERE